MDAFEHVVATILGREGFWVRTTYKVRLTKEEKIEIGRPSSPRWELDVVAYRPGDNLLRIVECKSYLDSRGVSRHGFTPKHTRLKLFNEPLTRSVVFRRLVTQLVDSKTILENPRVQLCLAAGNIVRCDREWIADHFKKNEWLLFGPAWIHERLKDVANDGYDNAIAAVTAKLLLRKRS